MYEPIAANIARRLTAQTATSALPDAPVLPGPARHRRAVVACLRGERPTPKPAALRRLCPYRDHGDQLIHTVRSFMEAHLAAGVSVNVLAAQANVSVRTLNRRFRMATGETPSGYLQRSASKRPSNCWKRPPIPSTTSEPGLGTATPGVRRAFTRAIGLGPRQYRHKYGLRSRDT